MLPKLTKQNTRGVLAENFQTNSEARKIKVNLFICLKIKTLF
jgi:hypothetical protein